VIQEERSIFSEVIVPVIEKSSYDVKFKVHPITGHKSPEGE
jgi:hypothetical protein